MPWAWRHMPWAWRHKAPYAMSLAPYGAICLAPCSGKHMATDELHPMEPSVHQSRTHGTMRVGSAPKCEPMRAALGIQQLALYILIRESAIHFEYSLLWDVIFNPLAYAQRREQVAQRSVRSKAKALGHTSVTLCGIKQSMLKDLQ